jgi:hypothetical protein
MPKKQTTVTFVAQYRARDPDEWRDLSRRDTPEEAFERRDAFLASWQGAGGRDDPAGLQVVRREITDTVIADPRPAPEPEPDKEGAVT